MNTRQSLEIERKRLSERLEEQPGSRVFAPLADCHRKLGNLEVALQICLAGLVRHPEYSSAYVILGKIHLQLENEAAAREAFEKVLELDTHNLLALRQLVDLSEAAQDFDRAMELWERVAALELDPAPAQARVESMRARLSAAGTQDGASGEEASTASAQVGQPSVATHALGPDASEDASLADDGAGSTVDDAAATPLSPLPPPTHDKRVTVPHAEIATITLAEIYAEQGFRTKALEIYRQVLQRNPGVAELGDRIAALESAAARGASASEPSPSEDHPQDASLDELEATETEDPAAPLTSTESESGRLRQSAGDASREDPWAEPRVLPSPPIEAPAAIAGNELEERERYSHFRSWLDRIRVDEH